jgi:hypothetical protein
MMLRPETIVDFARLLAASQLVDSARLEELLDEFRNRESKHDEADVDALVEFLQSRAVLTRWQCDQLKEGRYKGFFLGKYKLVDCTGRVESSFYYAAEDTFVKDFVTIVLHRHGDIARCDVFRGDVVVDAFELPAGTTGEKTRPGVIARLGRWTWRLLGRKQR